MFGENIIDIPDHIVGSTPKQISKDGLELFFTKLSKAPSDPMLISEYEQYLQSLPRYDLDTIEKEIIFLQIVSSFSGNIDVISRHLHTTYTLMNSIIFNASEDQPINFSKVLLFWPVKSVSLKENELIISFILIILKLLEIKQLVTPKEICSNFTINSNTHKWIRNSSPSQYKKIMEIIKIMINLSTTTKTAYKLAFLIYALQFGLYIDRTIDDLSDKIRCDISQMMQKHSLVVYKCTSESFWGLCQTLKAKNMWHEWESYIKLYKDINDSTFHDSLNWKDIFQTPKKISEPIDLTNSIEKIQLKEGLYDLLDNSNISELNNSVFILKLFKEVKLINFESYQKDFIILMLQFFIDGNADIKQIAKIFDFITFKIKDLESKNEVFVLECLELMKKLILPNISEESKRVNNLATLSLQLGKRTSGSNKLFSLSCFKYCAQLEFTIFKINKKLQIFIHRMNQISHIMIQQNIYEEALPFLLRSIEFWCELNFKDDQLLNLDEIMHDCILTSLKLLTKIISKMNDVDLLVEQFDSQIVCMATLICSIRLLAMSLVNDKITLISNILISAKKRFTDNGLFLLFLSKVCFFIEINGLQNTDFTFDSSSPIFKHKGLILSHSYAIQLCFNDFTNESTIEMLTNIFTNLKSWIISSNLIEMQYEKQVIETVLNILTYNKLHHWVTELLELLIDTNTTLDPLFKIMLSDTYMESGKYTKVDILLDSLSTIDEDPLLNMRLSLAKCLFLIKTGGNEQKCIKLIEEILSKLENDPIFSINNKNDKYFIVNLLFLLAKFSNIVATYHQKVSGNYIETIANLKREIQILQSIMKNFILNESLVNCCLNLNFKCILKVKFSQYMLECYSFLTNILYVRGLGKEFEYYVSELETFVKAQASPVLKFYFNLELTNLQLSIGKKENADILMKDAIFYYDQNSTFLYGIFNISLLSTKETFARYSGNHKDAVSLAYEFDTYMLSLLNSSKKNNYLIEIWIHTISRRLPIFDYDSSIWLSYFRDIDNKYVNALALYDQCNKLIIQHPKFDTLKKNNAYYPLSNVELVHEMDENSKNIVKLLNSYQITYSKVLNFEIPVDILKNDIDKLLNCFVTLVKFNCNCNNKDQLSIYNINDHYKWLPFFNENKMAIIDQKNELLPTMNSLSLKMNIDVAELSKLGKILPKNWISISIDYSKVNNCLTLVKYENGYTDPIFIELSLDNLGISFKKVLESLSNIITQSDESTKIEITSKIKTHEQKVEWWSSRKKLDSELKQLLQTIGDEWFSGFSSIFSNIEFSEYQINELKEKIIEIVTKFLKARSLSSLIMNDILKFINSIDLRIFKLFLKIDGITKAKVNNLLLFLLNSLIIKSEYQIITEFFDEICQELTLYLKSINKTIKLREDSHIFIIPGGDCVSIPWESISFLRDKSVSRFPSTYQLMKSIINNQDLIKHGIDTSTGYYVINPGGDLKRTEKTIGAKFTQLPGWFGTIGSRPEEEEILEGFEKANIYIYAGHGGGEHYIRSSLIKKQENIPPSLLLGCSSGLLKIKGTFPPYGTPYNFITGGCPLVLANLWDVTDKDTDLLTITLLTKWGLLVNYDKFEFTESENLNISECLSKSRDVCKLKYLNGAASVIYGLPLRLHN
ncbi:separase [Martiniozyma asiatica (nom. inval.)]|nr:separase [Martiniozyma asiatica]